MSAAWRQAGKVLRASSSQRSARRRLMGGGAERPGQKPGPGMGLYALPMPGQEPQIRAGVCYAMFAYDIGLSIDLEEAARRTMEATQPETIRHKRRAPEWLEFKPAPLRVIQS